MSYPAGNENAVPRPDRRTTGSAEARTGWLVGGRDLRLDFFRGLALLFIFIDHTPDNKLNRYTLGSFGFSDAAELFIFISGYAAGAVYGTAYRRRGFLIAGMQIYRRVWQLYVAHIFLFMVFTAVVSYALTGFESSLYAEEFGVGDFLVVPHVAVMKTLVLQFQPTFLDILPLYIVLLASFPLVLLLLRAHVLAALLPSLALYLLVWLFDFNLPAYPEDRLWFFNPFAWQLLFVLGAASAHLRLERGEMRPPAWLLRTALAGIALAAIVMLSWRLHGSWEWIPALLLKPLWPISKTDLSPIRLVHFLCLALVAAALVPSQSRWLASRWAYPFVLCGRHSLYVFCVGILLSVIGQFLLSEVSGRMAMQGAVNLGGGLVMLGTAALIAWYKDKLGSGVRAASQSPPAPRDYGA